MKTGGDNSILRIRTFNGDLARAQETKVITVPNQKKKKGTAQPIANDILKSKTPHAEDFLKKNIPKEKNETISKNHIPKKETTPPVKLNTTINNTTVTTSKKDQENVTKELKEITVTASATTKEDAPPISNNELGEGTIITNKRRKKHRLIPAIFTAVRSWFIAKKKEISTPKKPAHTINKAESRIATITAAARASNHAPQSDHGVVIKRLTKTKRKTQTPEILIKKKEETAAPQWGSINGGTNKYTDENSIVSETNILEPKKDVPIQIHHELPSTEKSLGENTALIAKQEETVSLEKTHTTIKTPSTKKQQETSTDQKITLSHTPFEKEKKGEPKKKNKTTKKKVSQKKQSYTPTPTITSGVPVYVYILVIFGASLLGIGGALYLFGGSTQSEEVVIVRIPSLFTAEVQKPIEINEQTPLISTLTDVSFTTRETLLLYPVITDDSGAVQPASTQTIFELLNFRAPGSFTRNVSDINFGNYNGTDPFILMKVKDFDTAFGGMLSWEQDISADLSPLFGAVVTESYDPYARTDTQLRSAFFRDTVVANKSARVLVNQNDTEKLIYAFINPNLILITTNSETFNAVLPLINQ